MEVRIGPESPRIELENGKLPSQSFSNSKVMSRRMNSGKDGKKPEKVESLADCIRAKYEEKNQVGEEEQADKATMTVGEKEEGKMSGVGRKKTRNSLVLFLSLSPSPEARAGLLPSIITLNDFGISKLGPMAGLQVSHIKELDLTGNLISDWQEVLAILNAFPSLTFLNLAYNRLAEDMEMVKGSKSFALTRLVLNGNKVSWSSMASLLPHLPNLNELRASNCNLSNPVDGEARLVHSNLTHLYLSRNLLSSFSSLAKQVLAHLPSLACLSVADCPLITQLPDPDAIKMLPLNLHTLNISSTGIATLEELERVVEIGGLRHLRLLGCPVLASLEESRAEVIARLPHITTLNGGDEISETEREDAERAMIRRYLHLLPGQRPARVEVLIAAHGHLDPLVKIDLTPTVFVRVLVFHGEEQREMVISVRQRVRHFKRRLSTEFHIAPAQIRLWYYDAELSMAAGPEEMKWPEKGLYTLGIRDGDFFVIERKEGKKQG